MDIFVIGAASSSTGKYSGSQNLSSMNGYQKGKNARQPTPDGMPFVTCMQKYGWQPNY